MEDRINILLDNNLIISENKLRKALAQTVQENASLKRKVNKKNMEIQEQNDIVQTLRTQLLRAKRLIAQMKDKGILKIRISDDKQMQGFYNTRVVDLLDPLKEVEVN